jgi:hypothetical protein
MTHSLLVLGLVANGPLEAIVREKQCKEIRTIFGQLQGNVQC